jgi:hypothetical protein
MNQQNPFKWRHFESPSSQASLAWWPKPDKKREPPTHCVPLRIFATQPHNLSGVSIPKWSCSFHLL